MHIDLRLQLLATVLVLSGIVSAQAPVISPTNVVYESHAACDGPGTVVTPVLQATGGSGNYTWTALTALPTNLMLNADGTFSGKIDFVAAGPQPWQFDVEVLDTTSSMSSQATITMTAISSSPGCKADDEGCVARSGSGPSLLLVMFVAWVFLWILRWWRPSAPTSSQHACPNR